MNYQQKPVDNRFIHKGFWKHVKVIHKSGKPFAGYAGYQQAKIDKSPNISTVFMKNKSIFL
ncbi:hypothetical protein [Neobacillus piezotolerans]|nr:hypothetical protein [Neobacillus piezotolerans]